MSTILFIILPYPSHYLPTFGLAHKLKQKGFEVVYAGIPPLKGIIAQQNAWCKMADITQTPTLYLNGYKLPEVYQISDLKYLTTSDLAKSTII